jgi:hypothetical protein
VEQSYGIVFPIIRAEGVGTDQFGQPIGLVSRGSLERTHLMEDDRSSRLGGLPGGLASGQAAADYVNSI